MATGDAPEEARNRAVTAEELTQRLSKTGGTVFTADSVEVELDEGLMVSASAVNGLRRSCWTSWQRGGRTSRSGGSCPPLLPDAPAGAERMAFTVSIARADQLTEALLAEKPAIVYIPAELLDTMDLSACAGRTELCAVLPRVFRTADEQPLRAILSGTRRSRP